MNNTTNFDWSAVATPLAELNQINQKASEEIIRESISFCTDSFGSSLKYVQTMPRTTNPEDYLGTQLKLFAQQGEKILEYTQNIFSIYQDALHKHLALAEEGFGSAVKAAHKNVKRASEAS